ncbi:MAG: NAD(P)-binding protein [Acidobacteriota bacterium]
MKPRDHELGMDRPITRRDFLNGMGIAVTGSLLSPALSRALEALGRQATPYAPEKDPRYYPPALTGLRGSHDGSWEVAHEMRDGKSWDTEASDSGESYDLVVVGGGISGLAAAYFFRKSAGPRAKILVLENHDDFGGHAKRNEFRHGERSLIGYGGTQSIDTPSSYSREAMGLVREIGIDVSRFYQAFDRELYPSLGLGNGVFFGRETFGADRLVGGEGKLPWTEFAARTSLSEGAQRDLVRVYEETKDTMPGLSSDEKKTRLSRISYRDFLRDYIRVDDQVLAYFQTRTHGLFGLGIEAVPALDCWSLGYPGFQGMGLERGAHPAMGLTAWPHKRPEPYIFHFPDGNASIARLLVRAMLPKAAPGSTMEDIVTARFDYARLDDESSPVRIRLNSTAVRARHRGDPATAKEVEVTHVRGGKAETVRASYCVLACWNSVIPYLCPELPEEQKEALSYAPKVPLVYTNVLIRNWTSFRKLGIHRVYCPGSYHYNVSLDFPVSLGDYRHPAKPEEPILLHLTKTPCRPGLTSHEQHKAGRYELLGTTFETFERKTRDQLARILSGEGFDPARDIEAITVNRWPHGYAYEYNSLFDPIWPEDRQPHVIGRRPFGRITIANSDAAAYAYTNAAIDQAYRAVREILAADAGG